MRIATWNINDVNKRLACLLDWIGTARPDVVCLQELKATDRAFPVAACRAAGYEAVWCGEKRWNGVAILARGGVPVPTRRALPGDADDGQSRYVEAAVRGVLVGCLYAPNGNPRPGPKWEYKLRWLERLALHAAALAQSGVPVVLAGDFNVIPTADDMAPSRSWSRDALARPEARRLYRRVLDAGYTDALASLHPERRPWTFWDTKRDAWPRDAGLRIDHLLLGGGLASRLRAGGVDREVRGRPGASDHAPAWIELGPAGRRSHRGGGHPASPVSAPDRLGLARGGGVDRPFDRRRGAGPADRAGLAPEHVPGRSGSAPDRRWSEHLLPIRRFRPVGPRSRGSD